MCLLQRKTVRVNACFSVLYFQKNFRISVYIPRKLLPYYDERLSKYSDKSVQEFRFALSHGIHEQIFYASFVKNIEKYIKPNHTINALKQLICYQGYHL